MNQIDLKGRRAVITGGAQGIGRAVAERFLQDGATVTLWDADADLGPKTVAELSSQGAIYSQTLDITDADAIERAAKIAVEQMGGVDILVNSAGIAGASRKTWEYSPEEWRRVVDIDLTGTFLCCRAVVPGMIAQKYGRIINIASIAGKEGNPNASAYSAAKAGVLGLTKSLGKELALDGVTVNAITPAAVRTAIFDQISQEHIDYMLSKIPMNRFGLVEEMAAIIAWLASEEASFSTGAVFDMSGGRATY
jgi:3-oxoacyl-[acyl-carrier protein] reductase